MSPHKRNKLKAKRTPWVKSRYSAKARAIRDAMRSTILATAYCRINMIKNANAPTGLDKAKKAMAMATAAMDAIRAVSKAPLYGSKTV